MTLTRRRFIRSAGIGAAALGLPLAGARRAGAADGPPRRLVIVFTPNGPIMSQWARTGGGAPVLGACLTGPLVTDHASKLLFVRGMGLGGRPISDERMRGGPHQRALGALLTGEPLQDGDMCGAGTCDDRAGWPSGPSVDQYIARELALRPDATPFPSLELGVRVTGGGLNSRLCFAGIDRPVPPENDPYTAYERVFGGLGDPARRQSVLDVVNAEIRALRGRLATRDAERLDAHVSAISELERRLGIGGTAACAAPALPAGIDPAADGDMYRQVALAQMDVLTAALACDRTRVASLAFSTAASGVSFEWFTSPIRARHHQLTHTDGTDDQLIRIYRWYAKQVANLLTKLETTADPYGGSLLDNTLVLWAPELSNPRTHATGDMPFVLAGGGVAGNRVLDLSGRWHNDLLAGICNWMGVPIPAFGHPRFNTSPVAL